MKRPTHRAGFTLIEMLIVLAIIGILAALIFPVMGRLRENARGATCMTNLMQLGRSFALYTDDYSRRFPGAGQFQKWDRGGHWVWNHTYGDPDTNTGQGKLCELYSPPEDPTPYEWSEDVAEIENPNVDDSLEFFGYAKDKSLFYCPSNRDGRKKNLSYTMNCALAGASRVYIRDTASIVLLVDEKYNTDGYFWAYDPPSPYRTTDMLDDVHNGSGNILFVDGHVKSYKTEAFRLDDSTEGRANKISQNNTPRFHDNSNFGRSLDAEAKFGTCASP